MTMKQPDVAALPMDTLTEEHLGEELAQLLRASYPMRREGDGTRKVSARGLRTRESLMTAAAELFARHGYQGTSVAQIAAHAGTSLGTFYQYFAERSDVVSALVAKEVSELLADQSRRWRIQEGPEGTESFLRAWVSNMAGNAPFWGVWEEVTHTDERLARVRRDFTRLINRTVAREIRRGQLQGIVDARLDADRTAAALTAMADRYVYVTYVFDPARKQPTPASTARVLASLWSAALYGPQPVL
jgi:AcrR family transcriptional regulator